MALKLAIVDDRPGVTRDRRFGMGRLGDLDLELIDTAGFEDVTDESLEARMRAQTELAVDEADVSLFVMDAREGVTPGDLIFADVLRRKGKPVVVLANKSESKASEAGSKARELAGLPSSDLADLVQQLTDQMHAAAAELQFEVAARLRDEIAELKKELRQMVAAGAT